MRFLSFAILISCLAMAACFAHHDIASTANIKLTQAQKYYPNVTMAELTKGADVYQATCQHCHALRKPDSRNKQDWDGILPKMFGKAKADSTTQTLIREYLYSGMKS